MAIVDWLKFVTSIREKFRKWTETIRKKDEIIKKLKEALEPKGNMECEHSAYWLKDDEGKITGGPFCQNCFDNGHDYRCLVQAGKPSGKAGRPWEWVQCPKCKVPFRQQKVGVYLNTH